MTYEEAIEFINSAAVFGSKLGLANITALLELLGNPQEGMKIVHVAGTNGKGSVCAYTARILMEAGYRTGLFTSPYLEKFTERIQVDFKNIPDELLVEYVMKIKDIIKVMTERGMNHPTFFELNTAIAFMYFKNSKCDAVVLETGLGGRFDSTNVIRDPLVSVITTISFDHMKILGDTIEKIAFEKAGIIKEGRPVVVYGNNPPGAVDVINKKAEEMNSPVYFANFELIKNIEVTKTGYIFDYDNAKGLEINMLGRHQIKNACLAYETAKILSLNGLSISPDNIKGGLENTKWPGRIEIISEKPLIICDATHNPEGATVLKEALEERFPDKRTVFVMGVMKDKEYEKMAQVILKGAYGAVAARPDWHRALDEKVLLQTIKRYCKNSFSDDTIKAAIDRAIRMAGEDGLVCTTGSLYYVADVKRYVRELPGGAERHSKRS